MGERCEQVVRQRTRWDDMLQGDRDRLRLGGSNDDGNASGAFFFR